ncbi:MAG: c-type cytochrome [Pseudomonadota bacterium]
MALSPALLWAQPAADQVRAQRLHMASCFICHGAQGESTSELFPRLAGQNAEYIAAQLRAYQTGQRQHTAMANAVARLTPEDMMALGRFYEALPAMTQPVRDASLAAVGRYIHHYGNRFSGLPSCASCHGADARGAATLPRLAGQIPEYLVHSLKQFNTRQRTYANLAMHMVAERMTELEMAAVAEYLSAR